MENLFHALPGFHFHSFQFQPFGHRLTWGLLMFSP
jgi:hypothetical protein